MKPLKPAVEGSDSGVTSKERMRVLVKYRTRGSKKQRHECSEYGRGVTFMRKSDCYESIPIQNGRRELAVAVNIIIADFDRIDRNSRHISFGIGIAVNGDRDRVTNSIELLV